MDLDLDGWFVGHQSPGSLPGPRVIAVEYYADVMENDMQYGNGIAYYFVGDVVRATGFPCFNLPKCICHFAKPDSVRIEIWVKGYDLLEV